MSLVLAETGGDDAAGRSGADDYEVVFCASPLRHSRHLHHRRRVGKGAAFWQRNVARMLKEPIQTRGLTEREDCRAIGGERVMKIGVLGTGSVGQTLATKLSALGHEVMLG